jgi:hypothetical protein
MNPIKYLWMVSFSIFRISIGQNHQVMTIQYPKIIMIMMMMMMMMMMTMMIMMIMMMMMMIG